MKHLLSKFYVLVIISVIYFPICLKGQDMLIPTGYNYGGQVYSLCALPDNSIIAGSNNGHIYKLSHFGETWNMVYSDASNPILTLSHSLINNTSYAGREYNSSLTGGLVKSSNNGNSWSPLSTPFNSRSVFAVFSTSRGGILAGCNSTGNQLCTSLYRSANNGSSWQGVFSDWDVKIYDFCEGNDSILYAAAGNGQVLSSSNDGLNWINIGPGGMQYGRLAITSSGILYYLNGNGWIYRKNPNEGWIQLHQFQNVNTYESNILINTAGYLYVTTTDGVSKSIDSGVTWSPINPANIIYSLAIDSNGYLWAGGNGWVGRSAEPTIPPGIPTPTLPFNGQTQQSLTPALSWQQLTGASLYQVQVSTNSGMTNPVVDDTTSAVSYTIHSNILNTNTVYYWQVRGHNINGWGNWSVIKHFKTYYPYIPDTLILTVEIGRAHLSWTPPDSIRIDAIGYNVYRRLGLNGTFSRLNTEMLSPQTVTYCDTLHTPGNYGYGVKAFYPPGVESGISNIVSADIQVQISAITALPAGGIYNQGQTIILTCPIEDADIYYTTDGSEPTESPGQHYTAPISVTTSTELKAKAFKQNWLPSITLTENYTILNPPFQFTAVQTQDAVNLSWQVPRISNRALLGYNLFRRFGSTGEFTHLNPSTLLVPTQYQDTDIIVGTYYYYLTAVYNEGTSDQSETISVTTSLTVSTPTFTPIPGTYGVTQYVRLNTTTGQDTIHYTRDGSNPTQSSPVYNVPIIVTESDTIKARSFRNGWQPSETVTGIYIIDPTGINDNPAPPINTSLISVYPNPFNHAINIRYSVAKTDRIRLSVYNIRGQLVKQLECANRKAGNYQVNWDGITKDSNQAPNGMYLVKMETSVGVFTHKIILVK